MNPRDYRPINKLLCGLLLYALTLAAYASTPAVEELRIKGWSGYFPAPLINQFEQYIQQKYKRPIKLIVDDTLSTPEQAYDAIRSQKFDLTSYTHNMDKDKRFDFYNKGLILPIDLQKIPNQQHLLPIFKNTDYYKNKNTVYALPFIVGPYALLYNPQKISTPNSWKVFWDKENINNYSISSDYYEINIYITAFASGITADSQNYYKYDVLKSNPVFLENLNVLVKNANVMWQSAESPSVLKNLNLATGWGTAIDALHEDNQPWAQAFPQEGTTAWFDAYVIGYSLNDQAPHIGINYPARDRAFLREAAHEWINYSLSPQYQAAIIRSWHSLPTIDNVNVELTANEMKSHQINDAEKIFNNMILWPTLSARDRNGLKQLWESAMSNKLHNTTNRVQ